MIDYELENRVVLVTGANNPQGIGATTALTFARAGAKVALVIRSYPGPTTKVRPVKTAQTVILKQTPVMPPRWSRSF